MLVAKTHKAIRDEEPEEITVRDAEEALA